MDALEAAAPRVAARRLDAATLVADWKERVHPGLRCTAHGAHTTHVQRHGNSEARDKRR